MKSNHVKHLATSIICCLMVLTTGCADEKPPPTPAVLHVQVTGMVCTACEKAVNSAVGQIDGVTSCASSFESGQAVVEVHDRTLAPAVIEAITRTGYTAALQSE